MSDSVKQVLDALDAPGIPYRTLRHAPAHTMEDCAKVDGALGALTVKNIFLTTKNRKHCYLCITRPEARFHTADISKQIGSSRLSFAPEEMLFEKLHCRSGSASPLGLIFDSARDVGLIVDRALIDVPELSFHPCDNTMTVAMASRDFFEVFLPAVGVEPIPVEIGDFME